MTAFHHPATMPVNSIGLVDRSAYRLGSALVRWSTHRAERAARRSVAGTVQRVAASEIAPELRHAVIADRSDRQRADARAAATLLLRR